VKSFGIALLGLAFITACSSGGTASVPSATMSVGSHPLSPCIDTHPSARAPVSGPAANAVVAGRFTTALVLGGGPVQIDPPSNSAVAKITADLARCNILAGYTNSGFDLFGQTMGAGMDGLSFGLAEVTIVDSLRTGHGSYEGTTGPGLAHPGPLASYQHRLAWVGVTKPAVVVSCPSELPGSGAPAHSPVPDAYQVMILDAATGGAGVLYTAPAPQFCGGAGLRPAFLDAALQRLSVPWTLLIEHGNSADISISTTSCDGFNGAQVNPDSGVLTVHITHPMSDCGALSARTITVSVASGSLPRDIKHGSTGAQDVAESRYSA
jgi:hypothetical protein